MMAKILLRFSFKRQGPQNLRASERCPLSEEAQSLRNTDHIVIIHIHSYDIIRIHIIIIPHVQIHITIHFTMIQRLKSLSYCRIIQLDSYSFDYSY